MKNILVPTILAALILLIPQYTFAQQKESATSANIKSATYFSEAGYDSRVKILKSYLESYNSPLAPYAQEFVGQADKYSLDWKLVAAISGVESTFGHQIPYNSYNAWGWGVYGDNVIRFKSWSEGIDTISQGLRERYINQWGGQNIYQIGANYAASPVWAQHVELYMGRIQAFALNDPKSSLPLSL